MTKEKKMIQLTLLFFGFLLILITYFLYPKIKSNKLSENKTSKQDLLTIEKSNEYLGEWASSKLGKNEENKKNYIQEIIRSDLEEAGQEDVFRKIKKDFQTASISIEETEIRDQMEKALLRAKEDFKK